MIPDKVFSIVDIETTGGSIHYDRITEIGIIQMQNGKVINEYRSFFLPGKTLSPWITELTGITNAMLRGSPRFKEKAQDIFEMLSGTIFVAHNARFDYSFIKAEMMRAGIVFNAPILCTVRLSRGLFPEYKKHSLDAIMERYDLSCDQRHRALDDALMVKKFLDILPTFHTEEQILNQVKKQLKQYVVPSNVPEHLIKNLPESAGIYKFYGKDGALLYVGKSINIRERVLSHFTESRVSSKELTMFSDLESIDWQETYGELGALLLESSLIKDEAPIHNRRLRRLKKMTLMRKKLDQHGFATVDIYDSEHLDPASASMILGIFRSKKQAEEFLDIVSKKHQLCPKLMGIEKCSGSCFSYRLGKCSGACVSEELPAKFNIRFDQAFDEVRIKSWPFPGPILVKETGDDPDEGALFLLDKWCMLAEGHFSKDGHDLKTNAFTFDFDQYKILSNYLLKKAKKGSIERISYSQMEELLRKE